MSTLMGPVLAGAFISTVLYGITVLQTYQYFNQYWFRDRWYLRIMVVVLVLVDLLVNVMDMALIWDVLIGGTSAEGLVNNWCAMTATVGAGVIAFIVQLFYAYRLWILSERSPWLPGIVTLISWITIAFLFAYTAAEHKHTNLPLYLYIPSIDYLSKVSLSCALAGDFLISTSMIVFLTRCRQVGLKRTGHIVNKLVIYTINSGLLTMICNAMALTLDVVYPRTFYYLVFYFSISTCYVTSVLAVLNTRESLRSKNDSDITMKFDTAGSDRDINPSTEISTFRIASPHMVSRSETPSDLGEGSLP